MLVPFSPRRFACLAILIALPLIVISCGKKKVDSVRFPQDCLKPSFPEARAERTSDIRVFAGESLWEYIDGDAEIYHQYNFESVATADYRIDTLEMIVDIYQFVGTDNAYGLYSSVRPDQPDLISIGVQGFITSNSLAFVKGDYVARLSAFVSGEETTTALLQLGRALEACLPGTDKRPQQFSIFPQTDIIPATARYIAMSFEGQAFLTNFFSRDYLLDGDTVRLFMTEKEADLKFSKWEEALAASGATPTKMANSPFGENPYFLADTFYGQLLAGVKGQRLVGMINYSDRHREFFADWLKSLQ